MLFYDYIFIREKNTILSKCRYDIIVVIHNIFSNVPQYYMSCFSNNLYLWDQQIVLFVIFYIFILLYSLLYIRGIFYKCLNIFLFVLFLFLFISLLKLLTLFMFFVKSKFLCINCFYYVYFQFSLL